MDPVSAAGIGLSVISVAFELFAGCIEGFALLSTAQQLGREAQSLLCMLNIEELSLNEWAKKAGLKDAEPKLDPRLDAKIVERILLELQNLLHDTKKLRTDYKLDLVDQLSSNFPDAKKSSRPEREHVLHWAISTEARCEILRKARRIKTMNSFPRTLWWAAFDRDKFVELINTIQSFVRSLWRMVEISFHESLRGQVDEILANVIRQNENIDRLLTFGSAVSTAGNSTEQNSNIAAAARLKAVRVAIDHPQQAQRIDSIKTFAVHKWKSLDTSKPESEVAIYEGNAKYIEWKELSSVLKNKLTPRIRSLAEIMQHAVQFRCLSCEGLCEDGNRVGFVFTHPQPENPQSPLSLKTMIRKNLFPSVTERIELALKIVQAVKYLHLAGWLHKNLRSENIIFFPKIPPQFPIKSTQSITDIFGEPYLAGFAFARESSPTAISEQPSAEPSRDIYRHPAAMGEPSESFDEHKDNYSLGAILVEIGEWRGLQDLLEHAGVVNIRNRSSVPLLELSKVSSFLRSSDHGSVLHKMAFRMGDAYRRVVEASLRVDIDALAGANSSGVAVEAHEIEGIDVAVRMLEECRI